jgi:hypothetical protein
MITGMGRAQTNRRPVVELAAEQLVDVGFQIPLGAHTHDLRRDFAVLEKEQSGNGADAILGSQGLFLIDIYFADTDAGVVFGRQLVEQGRDHFAGATPFGPEIDHDGSWNAEDFSGKICLI